MKRRSLLKVIRFPLSKEQAVDQITFLFLFPLPAYLCSPRRIRLISLTHSLLSFNLETHMHQNTLRINRTDPFIGRRKRSESDLAFSQCVCARSSSNGRTIKLSFFLSFSATFEHFIWGNANNAASSFACLDPIDICNTYKENWKESVRNGACLSPLGFFATRFSCKQGVTAGLKRDEDEEAKKVENGHFYYARPGY